MAKKAKLNKFSEMSFWAGIQREVTGAKFGSMHITTKAGEGMDLNGLILTSTVGGGDPRPDIFFYGKDEHFKPSKDGKSLELIGTMNEIPGYSDCARFLTSLIEAGFPEDDLDEDISVLVGLTFIGKEEPNDYDEKYPIRLVDQIVGDLPAGGSNSSSSDISEEAEGTVLEILGESDGSLRKVTMLAKAQKALKGNPNRVEVVKVLSNDEFLSSSDLWNFDGKELTSA